MRLGSNAKLDGIPMVVLSLLLRVHSWILDAVGEKPKHTITFGNLSSMK